MDGASPWGSCTPQTAAATSLTPKNRCPSLKHSLKHLYRIRLWFLLQQLRQLEHPRRLYQVLRENSRGEQSKAGTSNPARGVHVRAYRFHPFKGSPGFACNQARVPQREKNWVEHPSPQEAVSKAHPCGRHRALVFGTE